MGQIITEVITIDRSQLFDPVKFLGEGWSIDEQDERSLALTEVGLLKVQLVTTLREGEAVLKGEERLRRLKEAGHIRLDARCFQTLWENKALIPESWKERINGNTRYISNTRYIFFDGTVLRTPYGSRGVLYLYWDDGQWSWDYCWLEDVWDAGDHSAVLASPVRGITSNGASI